MIVFDPTEHSAAKAQGMLSQVVAPRPIALVSTSDEAGVVNVAPFSYYMAVTGRPLLVAISMGARESDGGDKDSYRNATRCGEFVINVTTDSLRDDLEVAAMEFPPGSSELDAVGWTPIPSQRVQPPSIAESPVHLECRIHQVVELGEQGVHFSGVHLVVAEVVCVVLDESVCDEDQDLRVDQQRLAPVGRMGFPWFTRSTPESMFRLSRVPYADFVATGRRPGPMD
jgi:flavin reductase (DIM6/NTAB) family NADH-FMN oxidoreductase RutF